MRCSCFDRLLTNLHLTQDLSTRHHFPYWTSETSYCQEESYERLLHVEGREWTFAHSDILKAKVILNYSEY